MYTADKYEILKITPDGDDPHYRLFTSTSGGYTTGDSWRMNSGITSITEDPDGMLHVHGNSGSEYVVHKDSQGVTGYTASIVAEMVEQAHKRRMDIEVVSLDQYREETCDLGFE